MLNAIRWDDAFATNAMDQYTERVNTRYNFLLYFVARSSIHEPDLIVYAYRMAGGGLCLHPHE